MKFETPVALSQTPAADPPGDFIYQEDGTVDLVRPGVYFVFWFVAQITGLSIDGQFFELRKLDYDTDSWLPLAGASGSLKISASSGFCTFTASEEELTQYEKITIALFNAAGSAAKLVENSHAKAGLLVLGIELQSLDSSISLINEAIHRIEEFIYLSDVTEIWSQSSALSGLGSAVIHTGYTYNFWGIGALNHQQTIQNHTTYYLIYSSQYQELTWYMGDSTIGTLWIETPAGNVYSVPIRFDATGIYFSSPNQLTNLPVGTTFKFTQALILVPPEQNEIKRGVFL